MANKNNAVLTNPEWFIQAGFDPKTGLPVKMPCDSVGIALKSNLERIIEVQDRQDAITRIVHYNLPNITSRELERLLYYKGQVIQFYFEPLGKFYYMPFAYEGTIDFYGRYNTVHPVPMAYGTDEEPKETDAGYNEYKALYDTLSQIQLNVYYEPPLDPLPFEDMIKSCVIIRDYTPGINANNIIPRCELQKPLITLESEMLPMMRTALRNATGVKGLRVGNQDEYSNVIEMNKSFENAVLSGEANIPVVGTLEFQDLTNSTVGAAEDYLMAMQSVDNFRLSCHGHQSGGLFQKKAHMLESENEMNAGTASSSMVDALSNRQMADDIACAIWDGMTFQSTEIGESALGVDMGGDGIADDSENQYLEEGEDDVSE